MSSPLAQGALQGFETAPIMVDRVRPCAPNRRWKWSESAHLFTTPGNIEALHDFARRLGLKRGWFQNKRDSLPHYDLTRRKHEQALRMGAELVEARRMVEASNAWREARDGR